MALELNDYCRHMMNPRFDIIDHMAIKKSNVSKEKLVKNIDILFFNFLNILKHKSIYEFYDEHLEKSLKLEFVQKYENVKYKQKDAILQHIAYDKEINLEDIAFLSYCCEINMCYIYNDVFLLLNDCNNNKPFYVVKKNKNIQIYSREKVNAFKEGNNYIIDSPRKIMYSASHYKVEDLKNICSELKITYNITKTKKENYDLIYFYLSSIIL